MLGYASNNYSRYEAHPNPELQDPFRGQTSLSPSRIRPNSLDYRFGEESIKISNYVTQQLRKDDDNKRILEKFRLDAIRHRNQKVTQHLGALPYLTESMAPGSLDASMFVDPSPPRPAPRPVLRLRPIEPYYISTTEPTVKQIKPRTVSNKKSVGIEVDFEKQFPVKKKRPKRFYTIEQFEEVRAFDRIGHMLSQINEKLENNSRVLSRKMPTVPEVEPIFFDTPPKIYYEKKKKVKEARPTVEYTSGLKRVETQEPRNLKEHLRLLKQKRIRLDRPIEAETED